MSSPWDDPSLSNGEFIKFENVGDQVVGNILDISIKTWDDGKKSPQLVLACDDGEERILTAGQIQLKTKLAELRPSVGDRIKIVHTSVEKRAGGKTLKHFDVAIAGAKAAPVPVATAADFADEPPF
jgi:hypothetical protein